MEKSDNHGLRRIYRATIFSCQGLGQTWRHEAAFRQEVLLFVLLFPAGVWLGRSAVEYAALFGSCLLVLLTELLNSAIEATVDRHGSEPHEMSKRAKDAGSAAVFVSLVLCGLVWVLIVCDRLL